MSVARSLFAALLLMGWLFATNTCLLAASGWVKMEHCCEDEGSGPVETNCAQCVTLQSGLHLESALHAELPPPVQLVCWELQALLAGLNVPRVSLLSVAESVGPPGSIKLWHFVARTALPVRAPSLFA
jgi:hypothetical protein